MSTAKLPTRSRLDDGRFKGGGLRVLEDARHPDPPDPPGHLGKGERELFRQACAEPESTLWRRSDAPRVARWAHLAARAETDPASWVYTQLNVLERQLVMTPLARAAAGITIEPAGVRGIPDDSRRAGTGSKGGRGKLTPQVRAELRKLRRDDPLGGVPDEEEEEAIEGNPSIADGAAS